jgi:pimeloyl-ACP methyl ester carboxylesterase
MISGTRTIDEVDLQSHQLEDAARRLTTIPVLLVRGRLSDVVSEQNVAEFRRLVPAMQYVEITGAAHTAASDVNDEFSDVVVDFVRTNLDVPSSRGASI